MKFWFLAFWLASSLVAQAPTAREIVQRIKQHLGVQLPANTVDTFKAGNPDTPVTGIAVTMMATYDVLERAVAAGDNLIITHEPTFYNHQDLTSALQRQDDAVLAEKQKFIVDHHLVIWRFHDGWHARQPDGILQGMTRSLGWQKYQNPSSDELYTVPEITVNGLALEVKRKLNIRVLRIVGDAKLRVNEIAFSPGAAGSARQIRLLERPDVQVLMIGEAPEWETIEYVADAVSQGKRKALLILGHVQSEQNGMLECADWLQSFIKDVPVRFVVTNEPFWTTAAAQ